MMGLYHCLAGPWVGSPATAYRAAVSPLGAITSMLIFDWVDFLGLIFLGCFSVGCESPKRVLRPVLKLG